MLVCEIPNIAMNFRCTGVWAHLPFFPRSNWKRLFRTKGRPTKVLERFRSKQMVRTSSIQLIPVQYWVLFWTPAGKNLNRSVLIRPSAYWMPIQICNQQMSVFHAASIQFQACPSRSFCRTRFGQYSSLCGGGFGIMIYASSSVGRWIGPSQDFNLSVSSNDLQIRDWESWNRVTNVNFMGEYPWPVGEYGTEWHFRDDQWQMEVVFIAETETSGLPPFRDPVNSTTGASSAYVSL